MVCAAEPVRHAKHVSILKNFVKEKVQECIIQLFCCQTADMSADILPKPLSRTTFGRHRDGLSNVYVAARGAREGSVVSCADARYDTLQQHVSEIPNFDGVRRY